MNWFVIIVNIVLFFTLGIIFNFYGLIGLFVSGLLLYILFSFLSMTERFSKYYERGKNKE